MTWTSPFTAVLGAVITSAGWNTSGRDNLNHLRALLPDAGGVGLPLVSLSGTTASFAQLTAAGLATDSVTGQKILDGTVTADELANLTVTAVKIANGAIETAKLADDAVTPDKGGVPNGAVVWFETAAELTAAGANWQAYTAADGRLLVGAGASASAQTFVEATNYGSSWTPAIGVSVSDSIAVSNGTLGVSGTVGAPVTVQSVDSVGVTTVSANNHSHTWSGSITGSISRSGAAAIAGTGTVWLPYMRAGVFGRKI